MTKMTICVLTLTCVWALGALSAQELPTKESCVGRYYKNYQNSVKELHLRENGKFKEIFAGKEPTAFIKKWKDVSRGKWMMEGDTITLSYRRLFNKSTYKYIVSGDELLSHFCVTTNSVECKVLVRDRQKTVK